VKQEETTMRITRIFAALIAALCILSILPMAGAMSVRMDQITATVSSVSMDAASANDNYPISVEQAKNSVRLFITT
jgi:spore maturation protein SpmB